MPLVTLAHKELRGALAGVEVPAVLDDAGRQLDDFLEAERVVARCGLVAQARAAGEQPQHALRDDRDVGADLVVAGADADHPAVVAQQLVGLHVGTTMAPFSATLSASHWSSLARTTVYDCGAAPAKPLGGDLHGGVRSVGHHGDQLAGDRALEGRLLPQLG